MTKRTPMVHYLKTDPEPFEETWRGRKLFETRCNDRKFQVGDKIVLEETCYPADLMRHGWPLSYTGRSVQVEVTHIMHGPRYGLREGWVIMSVHPPSPSSCRHDHPRSQAGEECNEAQRRQES